MTVFALPFPFDRLSGAVPAAEGWGSGRRL